VLTIASIILMSTTLITGIYGMNFEFMPELHWAFGYLWALGLMVVITLECYMLPDQQHYDDIPLLRTIVGANQWDVWGHAWLHRIPHWPMQRTSRTHPASAVLINCEKRRARHRTLFCRSLIRLYVD